MSSETVVTGTPQLKSSATIVQRILREKVRRFENQPRKFFDQEELKELAASIEEVGQKTPILVKRISGDPKHNFELIDGERRLIACGIAGLRTIFAIITDEKDTDTQFLDSVVSNFGRVGHTPLETAKAIQQIRDSKLMAHLSAGERVERIAKIFAHSVPWVYQHLSLLRLDPKVQAMMDYSIPKEKRLDFSIALYLTSLHTELQFEIAKKVVEEGMSIREARFYARRVAASVGKQVGSGRGRKPSDDYKILERFINRVSRDVDLFLSMTDESFTNMVKVHSVEERKRLIQDVEERIDDLNQLKDALMNASKRGGGNGR